MPLHFTVRHLLVVLSILVLAALPAAAIDEPLRALRSAKIGVETGPQPDIDLEAPPSAYPLKPVEQLAIRGLCPEGATQWCSGKKGGNTKHSSASSARCRP